MNLYFTQTPKSSKLLYQANKLPHSWKLQKYNKAYNNTRISLSTKNAALHSAQYMYS